MLRRLAQRLRERDIHLVVGDTHRLLRQALLVRCRRQSGESLGGLQRRLVHEGIPARRAVGRRSLGRREARVPAGAEHTDDRRSEEREQGHRPEALRVSHATLW